MNDRKFKILIVHLWLVGSMNTNDLITKFGMIIVAAVIYFLGESNGL